MSFSYLLTRLLPSFLSHAGCFFEVIFQSTFCLSFCIGLILFLFPLQVDFFPSALLSLTCFLAFLRSVRLSFCHEDRSDLSIRDCLSTFIFLILYPSIWISLENPVKLGNANLIHFHWNWWTFFVADQVDSGLYCVGGAKASASRRHPAKAPASHQQPQPLQQQVQVQARRFPRFFFLNCT